MSLAVIHAKVGGAIHGAIQNQVGRAIAVQIAGSQVIVAGSKEQRLKSKITGAVAEAQIHLPTTGGIEQHVGAAVAIEIRDHNSRGSRTVCGIHERESAGSVTESNRGVAVGAV